MAAAAVAVAEKPEAMQLEAVETGAAAAEGAAAEEQGEDLYSRLKTLQRQLEFLEIQVRAGEGGRASRFDRHPLKRPQPLQGGLASVP